MDIQHLFSEAARLGASDLHILAGYKPTLRVSGALISLDGSSAFTAGDCEALIVPLLSGDQKELLLNNKEIDFSLATAAGRFRANVYHQQESIAASFRLIPTDIKSVDALGLPKICHEFVKLRQGLVLVTGPTGHGKSTSLAAMIGEINQSKALHIITIEDPVEYVYPKGLSLISQREMHTDTHSWNVALRSALREDPDVVLLGEMRDFETIQSTLTVAETGHLVFATLHTNSAAMTVDRIVDVFPQNQQQQIRMQLASVIEGVLALRLVPAVTGGRVVVSEVFTGTPAIRNTIREGKTHTIDNIIQTSAEQGMMLLETSLGQRVKEGSISTETALSYALRPEELQRILKQ